MLKYVHRGFQLLGYNPTKIQEGHRNGKYSCKFYLCKQGEIDRFFSEIQPANHKHLQRFYRIRNDGDAGI